MAENKKLERLETGKSDRTAMHAEVMNQIIDAINRILSLEVVPKESGKFEFADANGVLKLTGAGGGCGNELPPAVGTFVCGVVDGVKQWIETVECACTTIDGGEAS